MTAPVSPALSETLLLLPATLHSPLPSTTNKRTLGDLHDGTPLIGLPLLRFYLFSFISLSLRALVKCADSIDQPVFALPRSCSGEAVIMSYPQGYLYQPPGSLALYSCPLAAPRSEELVRSSSGSAFSPYPGSAAFTASANAFSSPLPYSTDPATGFPSYMVNSAGAVAIREALFLIGMHEYCMIGWL